MSPIRSYICFPSLHSSSRFERRLLQPLQETDRLVHEPRLDPAGRAALDRDVAPEVAKHLPPGGRQHLERLAHPVLPLAADPVRLAEHPAAGTALDQPS